jgi:hypothetical protein
MAVEPYYDDGRVVIYHGDALELLPALEADSVITDPPYGTGYYSTDTACFTGDVLRTLVEVGPCAVFGYPERMVATCVAAGLVPDEWVTWWATNASSKAFNMHGLLLESEVVAVFGKHRFADLRKARAATAVAIAVSGLTKDQSTRRVPGGTDVDNRRMGDVWTDAAPGLGFNFHLRQHPNEKPMPVLHRLVEAVGVGTILDPFCGSGTTLRAARDQGHKAIGVELVEAHCETAAKRLAQGAFDFASAEEGGR